MKKHSSVLGLCIRASFKQALGLYAALILLDVLSFGLRFRLRPMEEQALEYLLRDLPRILASVFVFLTLVLCRLGSRREEGYTLERLSIHWRAVVLWQSLTNSAFYFLLLVVQTLTAVVLSRYFYSRCPEAGNQTLFLAFYQMDFLHALLPLDNFYRYLDNGLLILCLSLVTASVPVLRRREKFPWEFLVVTASVLLFFVQELERNGFLPFFTFFITVSALFRVMRKEDPDEEDA